MITRWELAERNRAWHHKRHARGECATAGCRNRTTLNPKTGAEFWFCAQCRDEHAARILTRRRDPWSE
jgi:hypothetical protein